jgi:hypothetical protein
MKSVNLHQFLLGIFCPNLFFLMYDKAYVDDDYVLTPRKKSHSRELTDEDKDFNRVINSARAAIENINQRIKTYAIIGSIYRGPIDDFHKITT